MRRMKRLLAALASLVVLAPATAFADGGDFVLGERGRFAAPCASVIRIDPAKTARIPGAIRAWNAAQSTVRVLDRAELGCGRVEIRTFDPKRSTMAAWVDYGDTATWSWTGTIWTYDTVTLWLPDYRWRSSERCTSLWLIAHELGHALGLPHSDDRASVMSSAYRLRLLCGKVGASDAASVSTLYAM